MEEVMSILGIIPIVLIMSYFPYCIFDFVKAGCFDSECTFNRAVGAITLGIGGIVLGIFLLYCSFHTLNYLLNY